MAMFGGKHYSNPAHGKFMQGGEQDGASDGMMQGGDGAKAKSYHVHHHADGSAHSHIHHADDSHEHTDHASAEEAHAHVASAAGSDGNEGMSDNDGDEMQQGPKPMKLHNVNRMSSGGF